MNRRADGSWRLLTRLLFMEPRLRCQSISAGHRCQLRRWHKDRHLAVTLTGKRRTW